MQEKKKTNEYKQQKIVFLLVCIPFIGVFIYNFLPKLFPPKSFESGSPVFFSDDHSYYWIWNFFELQSDGILSHVQIQSSAHPPKDNTEYLVPLAESDFEYYAVRTKKNKNFIEGLINLHTKVITDGKFLSDQLGNYTDKDVPLLIDSYSGYGPESYFADILDESLENGALLSIKRLTIGREFRQRSSSFRAKESFVPISTYEVQTVSYINLTKGQKQVGPVSFSTSEGVTDDLDHLNVCSVAKIPLSTHEEFREIGRTKILFLPRHYKRKPSSWLTWAYLLITEPFKLFTDNKPPASISTRCFHVLANFLSHNSHMYQQYFPDIFTSIVFCH